MQKVRFATAAMALALVGCGGGSSGGGGGGTPVANRPPSFTNATSFQVQETNNVGLSVIVQLTATDPDGDALTYSIVSGKDSARFIFLGTEGALALAENYSFETPLDGNEDNIYEVDVRVSDGFLSATQTIQVEVTNSTEGLVVTTLADNLGPNGSLVYLDETNEVLVVDEDGTIFRVAAATGAVVQTPLPAMLVPGSKVVDIAVDSLSFRNGHFFLLATNGSRLFLHYVDVATGDSSILYDYQATRPITGSLGMRGNNVQLALSDAGEPDEAQNATDPRGSVFDMVGTGDPADRNAYFVNTRAVGIGVRDPVMPIADNLQGWVIDRGERFNELNQADFPLSQGDANMEWPRRDGLEETGSTITLTGTPVSPRLVQEIGVDGAGRWLDTADSLQGTGWFGVFVISDSEGNIWTFDPNNNDRFENRNLDFGFDTPLPTRAIVSMDDGDFDQGNAIPIYMLRADGRLLVADLEQ